MTRSDRRAFPQPQSHAKIVLVKDRTPYTWHVFVTWELVKEGILIVDQHTRVIRDWESAIENTTGRKENAAVTETLEL